MDTWALIAEIKNKTGVISDPFGQTTVWKICFVSLDFEKWDNSS